MDKLHKLNNTLLSAIFIIELETSINVPVNQVHVFPEGMHTVEVFGEDKWSSDSETFVVCVQYPETGRWDITFTASNKIPPGIFNL